MQPFVIAYVGIAISMIHEGSDTGFTLFTTFHDSYTSTTGSNIENTVNYI